MTQEEIMAKVVEALAAMQKEGLFLERVDTGPYPLGDEVKITLTCKRLIKRSWIKDKLGLS